MPIIDLQQQMVIEDESHLGLSLVTALKERQILICSETWEIKDSIFSYRVFKAAGNSFDSTILLVKVME